jgi:hypothetical protein
MATNNLTARTASSQFVHHGLAKPALQDHKGGRSNSTAKRATGMILSWSMKPFRVRHAAAVTWPAAGTDIRGESFRRSG